ncbi:MAG: hypothetical protein JWL85_958 [Candidatus Saccharibacteria bacterium]|nr:hypothetical protein [Candidatus Saccharibacteria bacterium]
MEESPAVAEMRRNIFDRRIMLKNIAGCLGGAALLMPYVDQFGSDIITWNDNEDRVSFVKTGMDGMYPHTSWLVLPGYGHKSGQRLAGALQPTMSQYGQVAYAKYSDDGLDVNRLADKIASTFREREIDTAYLYGNSMGGMIEVAMVKRLQRLGIKIGLLVLDCTPVNFSAVRTEKGQGVGLMETTDKVSLYGGSLCRFLIEYPQRMVDDKYSASEAFESSLDKASSSSASNKLLQSESLYVYTYDPFKFKGTIDRGIPVIHIGPQDDEKDNVVYNTYSKRIWKQVVPQMRALWHPDIGHANPHREPDAYNEVLWQGARMMQLPDATQARLDDYGPLRRVA